MMVLMMMFKVESREAARRRSLYINSDMAGEEASLVSIYVFDWQLHDLPSNCFGNIV